MAVHGYIGDLGNGKTISAVGNALEHWLKGGTVVSNVSFKWDAIKEHCAKYHGATLQDCQFKPLSREQTSEFHRHSVRGTRDLPVLLIVDECARFFDSKAWNRDLTTKLELSAFLRESRKLHQEVILIVQKEDRLDKSFRELWEYRWKFRRFKWLPFLRGFIYQRQLHADTEVVVSSKWWRLDKRLFGLYDTDALYSDWNIAELPEVQPVNVGNVKKESPMVLRVILMLAIVFGAWQIISKLTGALGKKKTVAAEVRKADAQIATGVQSAPSPSAPNVFVQKFRGWTGRVLTTDVGLFEVGRLCELGRVNAVTQNGAIVETWLGPSVFVAAVDGAPAPVPPQNPPMQTPPLQGFRVNTGLRP